MGFLVLDRLAAEIHTSFNEQNTAPRYLIAQSHVWDAKLFLIKPLEYMNRSGGPIAKLASYFQIDPHEILVVHDDLDVPYGRIKFVRGGGHGGHNGIRSIIEALGTKDFPRLKIGIGRPPKGIPADKYVLGTFSPDEKRIIEKVIDLSVEGIREFVKNGIDSAMNKFNGIEVTAL